MEIYPQIVHAAQKRAVEQIAEVVGERVASARTASADTELNWNEMERKRGVRNSQVIEKMVELVGIEPTTSSLRTMRSPS